MTFYDLGLPGHCERWITKEWFWYQAEPYSDMLDKKIPKKEAQEFLEQRLEEIAPTGDDGTLAEREGIGCYCAG